MIFTLPFLLAVLFIVGLTLAAFIYRQNKSVTPQTLFWRKVGRIISAALFFLVVLIFIASLSTYAYCYGRCEVEVTQPAWIAAMITLATIGVAFFNTNAPGMVGAVFEDLPFITFPIQERWKGMLIGVAILVATVGLFLFGK